MYQDNLILRPGPRWHEPAHDAGSTARRALARVRKLLTGYVPGMKADPTRLRKALARPLTVPALERERLFALGWLAWLAGEKSDLLQQAERECLDAGTDTSGEADLPALEPLALLARSAYWLGRTRLRNGEDGVGPYETVLRKLAGSPRGTAWFVDLLWRAGRTDRAEQVWQSVRSNKRVLATDEGPLMDARFALRRGDTATADKTIREASPGSGPAWVEYRLLLAWMLANPRRSVETEKELGLAASGPYPQEALEEWRRAVHARIAGALISLTPLPEAWRGLVEERRTEIPLPALEPFSRYIRCVRSEDDPSEVLALKPPLMLAQRLRVRQAINRFLRRETGPAEVMELLSQAERNGYLTSMMAHVRRLCHALSARIVTRDSLEALIEAEVDGPAQRNARRIALELAERQLPPQEQEAILPILGEAGERLCLRLALKASRPDLLGNLDSPEASLVRHLLVGELPDVPPLRQALALHEAACKGDTATVMANLADHETWRAFREPPRFVLSALAALAPSQPTLQHTIATWFGLWPELSGQLAQMTGGETPPPGVEPLAWWLHQTALSLARSDAVAAWHHLAKARATGQPLPKDAELVEPLLRRRAEADGIARALPKGSPRAERLTDLAGLLEELPEGKAILDAALRGEADAVRRGLASLDGPLPPRLHHHLAILAWRAAQNDETVLPQMWKHWLAVLPGQDEVTRVALLDHLLGWHRERINERLARGQLESARRYWEAVRRLSSTGEEVARRAEIFRDEMATEALVHAREAMQNGDIPHGWRANHERGLTLLRRALSLDRDNVRLLTAILSICSEWFLDLYHTGDRQALAEQVSRHLLLANHLGRLVATLPGELPARAALAEFTKFRGFIEPNEKARAELYREGLKWDPANSNLRDLLDELGEGTGDE